MWRLTWFSSSHHTVAPWWLSSGSSSAPWKVCLATGVTAPWVAWVKPLPTSVTPSKMISPEVVT